MDKLQEWLRRIQRPPRREVANIDYWALLTETRIVQEAGDVERAFEGMKIHTQAGGSGSRCFCKR